MTRSTLNKIINRLIIRTYEFITVPNRRFDFYSSKIHRKRVEYGMLTSKVKREDEPRVFHLGGKIGGVDRGGSGLHKWPNLPVKRFREDRVMKGRQKRMPNRQVAAGIGDGQVYFSRAGQGRQRISEFSWQLIFRAEGPDHSNDGKPDGFRRRTNFSSEWSGCNALRDRRTRYTMEFHAIVRGGCTNSRKPGDWDI